MLRARHTFFQAFSKINDYIPLKIRMCVTAGGLLSSALFTAYNILPYLSENNHPLLPTSDENIEMGGPLLVLNPHYLSYSSLIDNLSFYIHLSSTPFYLAYSYGLFQYFKEHILTSNDPCTIYTYFVTKHPQYELPATKEKQTIYCSITREESEKPVCICFDYAEQTGEIKSYKHTYDYEQLKTWFKDHTTDPLTMINILDSKVSNFSITFDIPEDAPELIKSEKISYKA